MIGLFGGTFDPPHLGHLILAEQALDELDLDEVWWLLTPRSPLKPDSAPAEAEVRSRMVRAAIDGHPRFRLSRADLDRAAPHYMADTIALLREDAPALRIALLIGGDALAELPRWHQPRQIVSRCEAIGVMERGETAPDLVSLDRVIPGLRDKVRFFRVPRIDVTARGIRRAVAEGRSVRYLVPDAVREIIQSEGLYRGS